jgi:hypothetical protein
MVIQPTVPMPLVRNNYKKKEILAMYEDIEDRIFLREIEKSLAERSFEERINRIVKLFSQIEAPEQSLESKFWQWMFSPENQKEKELTMEQLFAKCMEGME